MLDFSSLNIWEDERKRIEGCLTASLTSLIEEGNVKPDHDEWTINGMFRVHLRRQKRKFLAAWTFHGETSVFASEDGGKPIGHPDMQFSICDVNQDQYDFHIEAKRLQSKTASKGKEFQKEYVINGVKRFSQRIYGNNAPAGAMIGYIQLGDFDEILKEVNVYIAAETIAPIKVKQVLGKTSSLGHGIQRGSHNFLLLHFWGDCRSSHS